MEKSTFETLYQPLVCFFEEHSASIDATCDSRKLFFIDFFKLLFFYYLNKCGSLKTLHNDLVTNDLCRLLKLPVIPVTTLQDGFTRFKKKYFAQMYQQLLKTIDFLAVPELSELGILRVIDGSLFPMPINIDWALYKKTKKAIKLHLSFSLNHMIPVNFLSSTGNSSERTFLLSILEKAVTYIADRGYFSFEVIHRIQKAEAFFILRIKYNMVYTIQQRLAITGRIPSCIQHLKDSLILFDNEEHQTACRLISFRVWDSDFLIVTNRFDLTTLQVLILYAYRWQVELLFKYIKRTLNGIHLLNTSSNGVDIQFYMLMIVSILQLSFKQKIQRIEQQQQAEKAENNPLQVPTASSHSIGNVVETTTPIHQSTTQTTHTKSATQAKDTDTARPTQSIKPTTTLNAKKLNNSTKKTQKKWSFFPEKKQDPYKTEGYIQPDSWMRALNKRMDKHWKISKQWLNTLKNCLHKPFDQKVIDLLSSA